MHMTLSDSFKGFIDVFFRDGENFKIAGWIVSSIDKNIVDFHIEYGADAIFYCYNDRNDVAEFYKTQDLNYTKCGFNLTLPYKDKDQIKIYAIINYENGSVETIDIFNLDFNAKSNKAVTIHDIPTSLINEPFPVSIRTSIIPEIIAVDNFYDNPDEVRAMALQQEFNPDIRYHKGRRTVKKFFPKNCKQVFEGLIGRRITNWIDYEYNGVFQYCTAEDPLVYHADTQSYAAAIYLTPNAPLETGTTFYRSRKHPEVRKISLESPHYGSVFENGFYDKTQFDVVDVVGNVYNRLVIWDARTIHSASQYFGNKLENSRLFHLFFFDIEE